MKNNKGFMLAEVVVTSTVIIVSLIGLYTTFNKIYNRFEQKEKYNNIDGVYAIKNMIDILMETGDINNILPDSGQQAIITSSSCLNISTIINNYCESLQSTYNIKNMYIIEYNMESIDYINVENKTFKDYIKYLKNYYDFTNNEYKYLFIVEYKDDETDDKNNLYYSNLGFG